MRRNRWTGGLARLVLGVAAVVLTTTAVARADSIAVEDRAGRTVTIDRPVERFVVSEGRYLSVLSLLRPENPIEGLVGMMSPIGWTDPGLEQALFEHFPETRAIPLFGAASAASLSVERIIELAPEVAIFGLGDHGPGAGNAEIIAQLEKAGTTVVFIDFRADPLANTVPSIRLLGRILGAEARAEAYIAFHEARRARIAERVASIAPDARPGVFLQVHPGRRECCWGMADGMLGPYVPAAGGRNIADAVAPGPTAQHTAEFLLVENPDVWVGTASGTADEYRAGKDPVALGAGMTRAAARDSLARYLARPHFAALDAVRTGRAHVIWHGFYNSPFNIVALEAFAAWQHPERFPEADPQNLMEEIHARFLPFPANGTYAASLGDE